MNAAEIPVQFQTEALSKRIDFLRGSFALWVLAAHTFGVATQSVDPSWWDQWPGLWLHTLFLTGRHAVTGFFFLSGFCIHWSISKSLDKKGAQSFSMASYLKARWLRIAPIFYIGLLFAVIAQAVRSYLAPVPFFEFEAGSTYSLIPSLGFLQGIFGLYRTYEPSWSITNEVIYYIAWPLLLALAGFRANRAIIFALLTALIFTSFFYILEKKVGSRDWISMTALWCIPLDAFMWIAGALCRQLYEPIIKSRAFIVMERWWVVLVIAWIAWATTLLSLQLSLFLRTVLDPFVYVAIPLLVLAGWKAPASPKLLKWLADLSYPLYLLHAPILNIVVALLYTYLTFLSQVPIAMIAGAVCLLVGGTVGVKLERYFLGLRKQKLVISS